MVKNWYVDALMGLAKVSQRFEKRVEDFLGFFWKEQGKRCGYIVIGKKRARIVVKKPHHKKAGKYFFLSLNHLWTRRNYFFFKKINFFSFLVATFFWFWRFPEKLMIEWLIRVDPSGVLLLFIKNSINKLIIALADRKLCF